jgi:hypothetical protein
MLSVLFCHTYFLRLDQKQVAGAKPYPPREPQLVLFYEDKFNSLSKMCLATMRWAACAIGSARRTSRPAARQATSDSGPRGR